MNEYITRVRCGFECPIIAVHAIQVSFMWGRLCLVNLRDLFSAQDLTPLRAVVHPPFFVLLVLSLKLTDFSNFIVPRVRRKFPRRLSFHLLRKDVLCYFDVCRS